MLGTFLENVYGIIFGTDVETEIGSFGENLDGSNYGKLELLFLGV